MEEDTAKESHVEGSSLVDFNRSGVPLLEIVTEPDIHTGEEARQFLIKLRAILRYLNVSTADMEKGAMRCEPNVSVRPVGSLELGVKTEIKNLNSFRSVRMAIEYEIARQVEVLESGGRVEQVTLGWDERGRRTFVQRSKEYAEDYRYFPEPDLPPLELSRSFVAKVESTLPELPDVRRDRLVAEYGLRRQDAAIVVEDAGVADYYESCVAAAVVLGVDASTVYNWVVGELFRLINEANLAIQSAPVTPQSLADLLRRVKTGAINANTGKEVLAEMFHSGKNAGEIIAERGLGQIRDADAIRALVRQVLEDNPEPVAQYLGGKETILGFLIGQVMRGTRGRADPHVVRQMLQERLDGLAEGSGDSLRE
jgi:aspartyl-tRNA(Asn)/glutamyl-tRNA(Gln) amidotransferase subunit B